MDNQNINLLIQLVSGLEMYYNELEKAYNSQDKEKFDANRDAILKISEKISTITK